jgi:hypothetical protein
MMQTSSLVSIWYKPKEVIRYLHQSPISHHWLMLMLSAVYFLLIGTFVLSLDKILAAPLLSLNGLILIPLFFAAVALQSFVIIYVVTFTIWAAAKCFHGKGTLVQTRGAIIWTLISTIPAGFFLLLINFAFNLTDMGSVPILIRMISYAGVLATLIHGFIVMLKTVAETQRFSLWSAFFATLLGLILFSVVLFAGRSYLF